MSLRSLKRSLNPILWTQAAAHQTQGVGFFRLAADAILQDDQSPDFVGQARFFIKCPTNLDVRTVIFWSYFVDSAVDEYDLVLLKEKCRYSAGCFPRLCGDARCADPRWAFRPIDLGAAGDRRTWFCLSGSHHRGVRGVEGFNVSGLGLSREVGIAVHGAFGQTTGFHGGYQLSLTNGVGAADIVNDNDLPAAGTRLTIGYGRSVTWGVGARFNRRTTGDAPDLIDQNEMSLTTDVQLRRHVGAYRIVLEGALTQKHIDVVDVQTEPTTTRMGYHGALIFSRSSVTLAYRYAVYDPTSSFSETSDAQLAQAFDADTLVHQTIGLSYTPDSGPLTLQANFTIAKEDDQRAYTNDRLNLPGWYFRL